MPPNEVAEFAREVAELPYIQLEGLMTMAPRSDDSEESSPRLPASEGNPGQDSPPSGDPRLRLPHLSMGMSQDYTVAVEEGATWLRLGTVLVGESR